MKIGCGCTSPRSLADTPPATTSRVAANSAAEASSEYARSVSIAVREAFATCCLGRARSSRHQPAAVDLQHLARHVAAAVGGQEQGRFGNLLGQPHALQRR